MPRGKKARTDEGEKKEPKPKGKAKKETVPEEVKQQGPSESEILSFIRSNSGNLDSLKAFKTHMLSASVTSKLIASVTDTLFELIEANPTHLSWAKAYIQVLNTKVLQPRGRIEETLFFPSQESENRIIYYLDKAEKTLLVCVYCITNDSLSNALRRARARGVDVKIISDDGVMSMRGSDVKVLHDEGFPIRVDLDPYANMHHKFVVIDDYILMTGSFNWTKQAVNKNQENIVIFDNPPLAEKFTEEFKRLWEQFTPSVKKYFDGVQNENPGDKPHEGTHVDVTSSPKEQLGGTQIPHSDNLNLNKAPGAE
jgi:mitochondrial cardiolipin hydrolase